MSKDNNEKVTIINPGKVEEYKNSNPDWESSHTDLEAVGKHFKADYVIYIELGQLSMYQPGSIGQMLYRGQANLTVSLVNVNNPEDFSTSPREISFTYPTEFQGGSLINDADTPPQAFRLKFLNALARRLSWLFAERPTDDSYSGE